MNLEKTKIIRIQEIHNIKIKTEKSDIKMGNLCEHTHTSHTRAKRESQPWVKRFSAHIINTRPGLRSVKNSYESQRKRQ